MLQRILYILQFSIHILTYKILKPGHPFIKKENSSPNFLHKTLSILTYLNAETIGLA